MPEAFWEHVGEEHRSNYAAAFTAMHKIISARLAQEKSGRWNGELNCIVSLFGDDAGGVRKDDSILDLSRS